MPSCNTHRVVAKCRRALPISNSSMGSASRAVAIHTKLAIVPSRNHIFDQVGTEVGVWLDNRWQNQPRPCARENATVVFDPVESMTSACSLRIPTRLESGYGKEKRTAGQPSSQEHDIDSCALSTFPMARRIMLFHDGDESTGIGGLSALILVIAAIVIERCVRVNRICRVRH
jgi:hypothetical protein